MIKHIVLFRTVDNNRKEELIRQLKNLLDKLPAKIKEIKYYETGMNVSKLPNAFDLSLISEFETLKTLESYKIHDEHLKIIDFIKKNSIETRVVDYEF